MQPSKILLKYFSFAPPQLGGWPVTQNRTDFNSTLGLLMRDYDTFPFFSLRVGPKEPEETVKGEIKTYIQASSTQHQSPILEKQLQKVVSPPESSSLLLLYTNRLISQTY